MQFEGWAVTEEQRTLLEELAVLGSRQTKFPYEREAAQRRRLKWLKFERSGVLLTLISIFTHTVLAHFQRLGDSLLMFRPRVLLRIRARIKDLLLQIRIP